MKVRLKNVENFQEKERRWKKEDDFLFLQKMFEKKNKKVNLERNVYNQDSKKLGLIPI